MRQFYKSWMAKTFIRPLLIIDLLAGIIAIVGGAITYFCPEWGGTMSFLAWSIPVAVGVASVIIGFLLAPYWIYKDSKTDNDKLKARLEDKTQRRAIRDAIAEFLTEGQTIKTRCGGVNAPSPREDFICWMARVEKYLETHLERSYRASFCSSDGLALMDTSYIMSTTHKELDGAIAARLECLNQFLTELRRD